MSTFTSLRDKLINALKNECATLHELLAKVEEHLKPIVEEDLKEVLEVGLAAGAAAVTSGQSFTLEAAELAAVAAGRAMCVAAEAKGLPLAKEAALAAAAAVHIPTVVPNGANG